MANISSSWATVAAHIEPKPAYITPERDEQGVFYGYKVLLRRRNGIYSPTYEVMWNDDGSLDADMCPKDNNRNGIYFCKTMDAEELLYIYRMYCNRMRDMRSWIGYTSFDIYEVLIVKCALSGTIIEGESGFRSEHAQIIEVIHGYRKDSQNSYEYSQDNSRPDSTTRKSYSKGWGESPITRSPWDISS